MYHTPLTHTHLVTHECGNGPPNLVVALVIPFWCEQNKQEPRWDGHLGEVPEELALAESHEGDDGVREEVHLPHKHIGGF